ncbi:hypothetical protein NMY22_g10513 [Coprinellus aureogranulatus]|nr:hypothetical protein NMY22_g10513 [Coprinellus aureogranulatus]
MPFSLLPPTIMSSNDDGQVPWPAKSSLSESIDDDVDMLDNSISEGATEASRYATAITPNLPSTHCLTPPTAPTAPLAVTARPPSKVRLKTLTKKLPMASSSLLQA